jgi:hypothetical protein
MAVHIKFAEFILFIMLGLAVCSCVSVPDRGAAEPKGRLPKRELLRTEPAQAKWKGDLPKNGEEIYFVGVSRAYDTAADARNAAREDAFAQIVRYYGQYISTTGIEKSSFSGSSDEILTPYIEREEEITRFAAAVVSQVGADRYFTEIYLNEASREEYVVYVLCQIGRARAERDIEDFARNISERYGNLIGTQNTLTGTLKACAEIRKALENNPLHRAVAWYDAPEGRVGLYEYCGLRINALVESVRFEVLPAAAVQQGESFTKVIKLSSTMVTEIGSVSCRVGLTGRNNGSPDVFYPLDGNGSFTLLIHTARLEPGNYSVQLELPLNRIAPLVRRNPLAGFSLEVKPLNTVRFLYQDAEALPLGSTMQDIFQTQGLLPVPSGGAYLAVISLALNERKTVDYYIIQPVITVSVELERDRTPLLAYTKKYGEFAHRTREAAMERAYRNIESDLGAGLAEELKSLGNK